MPLSLKKTYKLFIMPSDANSRVDDQYGQICPVQYLAGFSDPQFAQRTVIIKTRSVYNNDGTSRWQLHCFEYRVSGGSLHIRNHPKAPARSQHSLYSIFRNYAFRKNLYGYAPMMA